VNRMKWKGLDFYIFLFPTFISVCAERGGGEAKLCLCPNEDYKEMIYGVSSPG